MSEQNHHAPTPAETAVREAGQGPTGKPNERIAGGGLQPDAAQESATAGGGTDTGVTGDDTAGGGLTGGTTGNALDDPITE